MKSAPARRRNVFQPLYHGGRRGFTAIGKHIRVSVSSVVESLVLPAVLVVLAVALGEAHKPVTSKYTFNEHVLPIVRDRCGACHVDGGAAPMSLLTYADARPWAESIRAELLDGHMPPAQAESGVGVFRDARLLPPRDLDVVLTWATGGTPEGPPVQPVVAQRRADWPLGPPDVVIALPSAVTLPPRIQETTEDVRLESRALEGHAIRAVDLRPETPAMVRRAILYIKPPQPDSGEGLRPERVAACWLPDRRAAAPRDDAAFFFPRGAELRARITYRKTWKYENAAMSDRSTVGVYLAEASRAREIAAIQVSGSATIPRDVQAIAIRADVDAAEREVEATAVLPDGSRRLLIRFTGQREWPQRFWYEQPVALPRGARLESAAGVIVDVVRAPPP